MTRPIAVTVSVLVGLANAIGVVMLVGYAQALVDMSSPPHVPWLGPAITIVFFPARYILYWPAFNHPLGLGGPRDFQVFFAVAFINGLIWGLVTYAVLRRRVTGRVPAATA